MKTAKEFGVLETRLEHECMKEAKLIEKLKKYEVLKEEDEDNMELNGKITAAIEQIDQIEKEKQRLDEMIEKVKTSMAQKPQNLQSQKSRKE